MDREETTKVMALFRAAYPKFYDGKKKQELENIVSLWNEMFPEPYEVVAAAVKSLIQADDKGFPPVIGQVKAKIRLLTQKQGMTEAEAWKLVRDAIKNSGYEAKKEFDKLPPVLQKLVGSPSQLRDWASMDTDTLQSVVASNFQRSYRAVAAREREISKLPEDVRRIVESIQDNTPKLENAPTALLGPVYEDLDDTLERMRKDRENGYKAAQTAREGQEKRKEEIIAILRGEK